MVECWYDDEAEEIVIKVGKSHLAWMVQHVALMQDHEGNPWSIVASETQLAKDVTTELTAEEEDGTTLIHKILDEALYNAAENGSEGFVGV